MSGGPLKIIKKVLLGFLITVMFIPVASLVICQIPAIQTYAAQKVVEAVSGKLNGTISIDRIALVFFNRVMVYNATIKGNGITAYPWGDSLQYSNPGDTMAHVDKVSVTFDITDLMRGKFHADRVSIDGGCFNILKERDGGGTNITRIFKAKKDTSTTTKSLPPDFTIREVKLNGFNLRISNPFSGAKVRDDEGCMNYKDIQILNIVSRIENGGYVDKQIVADIKSMSAMEKCGMELKSLVCKYSMGGHQTSFKDMELVADDETRLTAHEVSFSYESPASVNEFVDEMEINADFDNALFGLNFLKHFTPDMRQNHTRLILNGKAGGLIKDLHFDNLTVATEDGATDLTITGTMKGLPEIDTAEIHCSISSLNTTLPSLFRTINSLTGKDTRQIPAFTSKIAKGQTISHTGTFDGTVFNFDVKGTLAMAGGSLIHDISFQSKRERPGTLISGDLDLEDLDLGKVLGNPTFEKATGRISSVVLLRDKEQGGIIATLDTCRIKSFNFNGYDYSGINMRGYLEKNILTAKVDIRDSSIRLSADGTVILPGEDGYTTIRSKWLAPLANLSALNFSKKGDKSRIDNLSLSTNIRFRDINTLFGEVFIDGLTFTNKLGTGHLESLSIKSDYSDYLYRANMNSPFFSMEYKGCTSMADMISRLSTLVVYDQFGQVLSMNEPAARETASCDSVSSPLPDSDQFSLKIKTVQPICHLFAPKLFVANGTSLDICLTNADSLSFLFKSKRISHGGISANDIRLSLSNPGSLLWSSFTSSDLKLQDFDLGGNNFDILSRNGQITIMCLAPDNSSDLGKLTFSSDINFRKDERDSIVTEIKINPSTLNRNGEIWHAAPSTILLGSRFYAVNNFRFAKEDETEGISINGVISPDPESHIKVELKNMGLAYDVSEDATFGGYFTGSLDLNDFYGRFNLMMDVSGDSVIVYNSNIGQLKLLSKWDFSNERLNLLAINKQADKNPFNISGYYKPEEKSLFLNASLADLAATYVKPLLKNYMDITGGTVSGDISLRGPVNDLTLLSDNCQFNEVAFTPNYTKVPYVLTGQVMLKGSSIDFPHLELKDHKGHSAVLAGYVSHHFFRDIALSANLDCNDFACINLTEKDNPFFYGTASVSGRISIEGPVQDLKISSMLETGSDTYVHIPLSNASSAASTDLLVFKEPDRVYDEDEYFEAPAATEEEKGKSSGITVQAFTTVKPDAKIAVEIDKQLEDIITCRGGGNITVNIEPHKSDVDIHGIYTIADGDIRYAIAGILPKVFTLKEGGTVSFNGPFAKTNMDLSATYHTKASVATLIGDTSSTSSRQDIYCDVGLNGQMVNPKITFNIEIPNLDPLTKSKVESALSTEAKVQEQVFALLATGSFIATQQSGVTNSNSILYSNFSEILSSQINNIFRQLDVPLDMGLNYRPGDTRALVDFNVSYKAFNNRLIINGKVGNSQTSRNWGGDLEAEVKLDKKGLFRFSLFTRAPDSYTDYLDNTQRSGLGFSFQNEFNKFVEIFQSEKKKEAAERKRILEAEEELRKSAAQQSGQ